MEIFPTKDVAHSDLAGVKDWVASDDSQYTITRVDELYTSHNPLYSEVHAVRITSFFIVQHTAKHVIYVNSHGNGAFVYMSSTGDPGNIVSTTSVLQIIFDKHQYGTYALCFEQVHIFSDEYTIKIIIRLREEISMH